jgi:hypothetical protein
VRIASQRDLVIQATLYELMRIDLATKDAHAVCSSQSPISALASLDDGAFVALNAAGHVMVVDP